MLAWLRARSSRQWDLASYDARRMLAPHVVLDLAGAGLFGMLAPTSLGGLALSYRQMVAVAQQLAAIDVSIAAMVGIHNSLCLHPVLQHGSAAQRQLMQRFAQGRALLGFAITEAAAGSDPRGLAATARMIGAGRWRLDGRKLWIGNAGWADALLVFARTQTPDGGPAGYTAFLIPTDRAGVAVVNESMTLGLRAIVQNEVVFDAVELTEDDVVGTVGRGFEVVNSGMHLGRLGIAAMCAGAIKQCFAMMHNHAARRIIAERPLGERRAVEAGLARVATDARLLDEAIARLADLMDNGCPVPETLSLALKIVAPELAWRAADDCVQMLGGRGYEELNGAARLLRDVRIFRIFEGPTETLQTYLGSSTLFSQRTLARELAGAFGADHPQVAQAVADIGRWSAPVRSTLARPGGANPHRAAEYAAYGFGQVVAWRMIALLNGLSPSPDDARLRRACERRMRAAQAECLRSIRTCGVEDAGFVARMHDRFGSEIGEQAPQPMIITTQPDPLMGRAR
jgi:alkylation response protein AidB-like acyl-CoA dehydrogenase